MSFCAVVRSIRVLFLAGVIVGLAGCGLRVADSSGNSATFAVLPPLSEQVIPEMAAAGSVAWVLAQEEREWFMINGRTGERRPLVALHDKALISQVRMYGAGEHLLLVSKEIFVDEVGVSQVRMVATRSTDGGATLDAPLVVGVDGRLVAWVEPWFGDNDEPRLLAVEEGAQNLRSIVLYRWVDGALESRDVVRAESPAQWRDAQLARHGEGWVAAWVEYGGSVETGIRWATSADGEQWSDEKPIPAQDLQGGFQLLGAGGHLTMIWMDKALQLQGRSYTGEAWTSIAGLPGSDEGLIGGFRATAAGNGSVHLIYALFPEQGARSALYHRSIRNGSEVSAAQRLNRIATPHRNTADWPMLAIDSSGQKLMVAWLDVRHYRPTIYANYSIDAGLNWQEQDFPVSAQPGLKMSLYPRVQHLGGSRFAVVWTEFPDTLRKPTDARTVLAEIDLDSPLPKIPEPQMERLEQRVKDYWGARMAGAHERTFPIYDPYYRDRSTPADHLSARSRFKVLIHGFEIEGVTPVAFGRVEVKVRFEHEVKEVPLPDGKTAEVPRGWVDTTQQWVWIGDDWYLVYVDLMNKPVMTF